MAARKEVREPRPPVAATWLIERVLPADAAEALLGDLEEVFHRRIAGGESERAARRWYWWEASAALMRGRSAASRVAPASHRASGGETMTEMLTDLRLAVRMLVRQPVFTLLVVGTAGLGIGAATTIFSAINPILFEPLPYPDGDRVALVWESAPDGTKSRTSFPTYRDVAERTESLESVAVVSGWQPTLHGDVPEALTGQMVTSTYLEVLGVAPALGRNISREDDVAGAPRVVILSDGLWRSRFGADPSIVGGTVNVNGTLFTVIGVMPRSFENVLEPGAQIWTALRQSGGGSAACRTCRHLRMVARLEAAVEPAQAQAELSVIAQELAEEYPGDNAVASLTLSPLDEEISEGVRPALVVVAGAVLILLLIACVNVINLLLARGAARRGEFAIRAALGAGRSRVMRQVLTESALVGILGGAVGVLLAHSGVAALVAMAPAGMPRLAAIRVDSEVLIFALAVSVLTGIGAGLLPALDAGRRDLATTIRMNSRRTTSSHATRRALVAAEIALALMLLVGAGLLLRSLHRMLDVDPGFATEDRLAMRVRVSGPPYTTTEEVLRYSADALAAVRAVPGVESAAMVSQLPLSGEFETYRILLEDGPAASTEVHRYGVAGDYHGTMGIPILQGRGLTSHDDETTELVVLVSASFAAREWPGEDPIGRRVRIVGSPTGPWRTVVGVSADVRPVSLAGDHPAAIYLPSAQRGGESSPWIVVRTSGDPAQLAGALREAVSALPNRQPIMRIETLADIVSRSAQDRRFSLLLFQGFAVIALVLAAAGIYGVMAGAVTERIPEMGIRAALGAGRSDLVLLVLRDGLVLIAGGTVAGLAAASLLAGAMTRMLFDVPPRDATTFAMVTLVLGTVALLACGGPAWRASRVDPARSMRAD